MASLKLILFDIDGTLIDTGGAGARSWTWAFEHAFDRPGRRHRQVLERRA